MPATKSQTAPQKANAAAETFAGAQGEDPEQLAQVTVLAALTGLTAKFVGVETTVSEIAARQVALESAHIIIPEPERPLRFRPSRSWNRERNRSRRQRRVPASVQ